MVDSAQGGRSPGSTGVLVIVDGGDDVMTKAEVEPREMGMHPGGLPGLH